MHAPTAQRREARYLRFQDAFAGVSQAPECSPKSFEARLARFVEDEENISSDVKMAAKVVVVGPSGVGKSCLMLRHCEGTFSENYKSTIGVDFMASRFSVHDVRFILQIWDTAGQERFKSVSSAFFRGAMACFACFDLSDADSVASARAWGEQVRLANSDPVSLFLVGCKADLPRAVAREEAEAVAREMGAEYSECSARTGAGVDDLFDRAALVAFDRCLAAALPPAPPAPAGPSSSAAAPAGRSPLSIGKILPTTRTPPRAGAGGAGGFAEALGVLKLRAVTKLTAAQQRAAQNKCCT